MLYANELGGDFFLICLFSFSFLFLFPSENYRSRIQKLAMFNLHHVLKVGDFILGKLSICYTHYLTVKGFLQSVSIMVSISFACYSRNYGYVL